jgi:serine/threonine protein kinase
MVEEMGNSLLALLAWLREKGVAVRDLKPDNLLVAGDPKEYPHFLVSATRYTIGLIDLETAVVCGETRGNRVEQPNLSGTPLYATPSHFFANGLLEEIHGDLAMLFHLQDWFSMTAIVFETVAGKPLFHRSARLISALIQKVRQGTGSGGGRRSLYVTASRRFWPSADRELRSRLKENADRLLSVQVRVPEGIREVLAAQVRQRLAAAQRAVEKALDAHEAFARPENRQRLLEADADQLKRIRDLHRNGKGTNGLRPHFDHLIEQVRLRDELRRAQTTLSEAAVVVRADLLLEWMFDGVRSFMEPLGEGGQGDLFPPDEEMRSQPLDGLGYSVTVETESL